MNMLTPTTGLTILTLMLTPAAYADHTRHELHRAQGIGQYARVVRVEPVVRKTVVRAPMRECRLEETRYPTHDHPRRDVSGPMIVGGVIGAALGHEIGHGRDAATLLGAVIGSSIARDAALRGTSAHYVTIHEERCRVVQRAHVEQPIEAYRVSYRHRGGPHGTRRHYHPEARGNRTKD